ncbi:hypothetical protein PTTG_01505 [Puccinia triticina 1-1 BBBD Race 1]|uniref:Uncharacterized protein n=1 Tax=Puccinia triticina (isolate 1-1 / race 1 (BBBD)) TaxID=630390 RepID=A0A0C4EL71_PUCT1|nr:hypothetical protein PTTG_01505 [Puccinia triticina 1-1 BBBD Race 1]
MLGRFPFEILQKQRNFKPAEHLKFQLTSSSQCGWYFMAEQQKNYLIKIVDGKLVWAKGTSSSVDSLVMYSGQRGITTPQKSGVVPKRKSDVDPKAIMDNLLQKTLNANTWIFVADQSGNIKKKAEIKSMMKKLWNKHNDQDPEALAAEKEKNEDRPAQVAAEHASHQGNWQEAVRVNRLARVAGEEERKQIKKQQGALKDGRLRNSVVLPSPPHEGKKKEDMTDDKRVERGAALVARVEEVL